MPDEMFETLRAKDQRGMGRVAGGMGAEATDRLSALDSRAQTLRAWSPDLVPGLLQTDAYAAVAIQTMTPSLPGFEITARVKRRAARRQAFLDSRRGDTGPGFAYFLMGESAVANSNLPGPGHAAQLRRLLEIIDTFPRISVQMIRDGVSHPGTSGPFSIHALQGGARVGHLESLVGGWYTTTPEDISRLYSAFSDMSRKALSASDTRDYIAEEIATCWASTTEPTSTSRPTQTPTTASSSHARPDSPSR